VSRQESLPESEAVLNGVDRIEAPKNVCIRRVRLLTNLGAPAISREDADSAIVRGMHLWQ